MKYTINNKNAGLEDNQINIDEFSITYTQPADCNDDRDNIQAITISAVNNGMGGDGWYYNIEIKEGHWSIGSSNELVKLIEDFNKRFNLETSYEEP